VNRPESPESFTGKSGLVLYRKPCTLSWGVSAPPEASYSGEFAGVPCFVLEALSDTLTNDHAEDTVFPLFLPDDVVRDVLYRRRPSSEPA
jgi:hypothetical protein